MAGSSGGGGSPQAKGRFATLFNRKRARIEIIPLIDVMFFLLAAFLLITLTMEKMDTVKVGLPGSTAGENVVDPELLNIGVNAEGRTFLAKKEVPIRDLLALIQARYSENTNLSVYVSGDTNALHGTVVKVLNQVRGAGIMKVSFAVQPRKAN